MCIEPIELWLDMNALRRGLIAPVHPEIDPFALLVQDSGMVPVSTQVCIVNPETNCLCHVGEYGEIWVQSEATVHGFYQSKDIFDKERFNGRTADGDPNVKYMRTGDLGFLHTVSRPIGAGGAPIEMQILFVLGSIGETFEVNGLLHFPVDIEASVERCHRNIVPGGCALFQAGGLVVVLVEIFRKNFLASIVPVIVNSILNQHHMIVDIVAFVQKGDFPRSRLGEKQRGKILAGWVTRKIQTIAQFKIRDLDDEGIGQIMEEGHAPPKHSTSSRNGGMSAQGHRRPDSATASMISAPGVSHQRTSSPPIAQVYQPTPGLMKQLSNAGNAPEVYIPQRQADRPNSSNHFELPAPLSIPELPSGNFGDSVDDDTPTNTRHPSGTGEDHRLQLVTSHGSNALHLVGSQGSSQGSNPLHYSPIDPRNNPFRDSPVEAGGTGSPLDYRAYDGRNLVVQNPERTVDVSAAAGSATHLVREVGGMELHRGQTPQPPPPSFAKKPYLHREDVEVPSRSSNNSPSQLEGDRFMLPSQQRRYSAHLLTANSRGASPVSAGQQPSNGGLRVANVGEEDEKDDEELEDEWANASRYMAYTGTGRVSGHYGI